MNLSSLNKPELRSHFRDLRRSLSFDLRKNAGAAIQARLIELAVYRRARCVHTYVAWRDEVDNHALIRAMLAEGRRVAAPKVVLPHKRLEHYFIDTFDALGRGAFGILEPQIGKGAVPVSDLQAFDLIIVPGVAFDRSGNRLGYGSGHYDRFLTEVKVPKVALAFAAQVAPHLPAEVHDQRVDIVVTEDEIIFCRA